MAYQFPLNGGRINASVGGNSTSAGAGYQLVSTGTLHLAGGNNVTLSQNANSISIAGPTLSNSNGFTFGTNGTVITASYAGGDSINFSAGTTSSNLASVTFANSNGVSFGLNGGTITGAVATNYAVSNHSHGNPTLNLTNLSGTTGSNSGGLTLSLSAPAISSLSQTGIISLSQNGNTISIGAPAFSAGISSDNTVSNQLILAAGNNITLSQSTNASGATISITGGAGAGNPVFSAGATSGSLGSIVFSNSNGVSFGLNGSTITASADGGGGGGGGIALANSQTTYTSGTANLNASGALTIASTTGQQFNFSVPATSSLSGAGGISISTNGSTIIISNVRTLDYYQNMDRGASATIAVPFASLMLQRLNQENGLFAADLTANTVLLNMTANMTATSLSNSHSVSVSIGIYSDNVSNLTLINSASTSWALGAATGNTSNYHGPRWLSFVSSQWSSAPNFVQGGDYVFGIRFSTSNYAPPMSYIGQNYMFSNQRSGFIGTSMATATTLAHGNYWNAVVNTTALPSSLAASQVNRINASAIFIPHMILNNRYSDTL